MKKRFLWLLLAFSLLTSQVCSTVAYANLVVDVETVDVPDVGGETAPLSVPMTGVELETEGEHTETSTTPQPEDSVQPTADPQPEDAAEPVENASSSEISVDSYDALIKAIDQINAETDDAGKKYVISITDDFVCRSKQVDIRKDITILGNGHTLTFEDRGDGSLLQFQMRTGGTLSLGMPDGGARNELTFDGEGHYRASAFLTVGSLSYKEKGELNIYDGVTITGLQGVLGQPGSTILVENGVFNMYGGKISGNTKDSAIPIAGTIAHYNPGVANITAEINLYGGEITGNTQKYSTSAYYAGAVMMIVAGNPAGSSAAFHMTGGTIADNDSSTRGKAGGVNLYGSAVHGTISGGQIDRNTAYEGGGICVGNGATLDITGGSCTGNKALDGAGVYIGWDTKVNMKNYRITDNVAENNGIPGNGGGISVYSHADVNLEACEISGNTAIDISSFSHGRGHGGGIYTSSDTNVIIKKCTISRNTANVGGGVLFGGSASIQNSEISGNNAGMGGGVHVSQMWKRYDVALRMNDTKISENTAVMGGGLYTDQGVVINGGEISNNKSIRNDTVPDLQPCGGGIAIHLSNSNSVIGSSDAGAEPVRIFGNQCEGDGGGLYVFQIRGDKENILVQNTEITQNQANSAAGICIAGTEVTLKNASVTQNHSTKTPAGGVAVRGAHDYFFGPVSPGALKLADQVTVWDNSAVGADGASVRSNVYLAQNDAKYADNAPVKITIAGKLDETSKIGVTEECAEAISYALEQNDAPVPSPNFTTGLAASYTPDAMPLHLFKSDNPAYMVDTSEDKQEARLVKKTTHTITFDANGGVVNPASAETESDGTLSVLPTPTYDGFTFVGWFTAPEQGVKVDAKYQFTQDATIYAHWEAKPETENLDNKDPNGGTSEGDKPTDGNTKPDQPANPGGGASHPEAPNTKPKTEKPKPKKETSEPETKRDAYIADPNDTGISKVFDTEHHRAYMIGYDTGLFGPESNITRAEVARVFYNLLIEHKNDSSVRFSDVPAQAWYYNAVAELTKSGIIRGYEDGTFRPDQAITRAEFTAIAARFAKISTDRTVDFSDVSVNMWYYDAVRTAVSYGWVNGYEDGTFRPEQSIARGETATIVNRMLARIPNLNAIDQGAGTRFADVGSGYWGFYEVTEATTNHEYTRSSNTAREVWTSWESSKAS